VAHDISHAAQIHAEAKAGRLRTSVAAFVLVMLGLVLNTWTTFWL
jgi:hypothetical protein